jgi:hypothetical protein
VSTQKAEIEVIWFLQEADTSACGIRATAWSFLEEAGPNAGGRSQRSSYPRDCFPEHAEQARRRLRRAHACWCALEPQHQAVLSARFLDRGLHRPTVPGLGEWTWVGELLEPVRRRAESERTTPFEALKALVHRSTDDSVLEDCRRHVRAALERFGTILETWDNERRNARLVRLATLRGAA